VCGFSENPYHIFGKSIHKLLWNLKMPSRFVSNSKAKIFGIVPD
jgi:hypothetical protein